VRYTPTAAEAVEAALKEARAGDVLLTMGAGDVSKLGEILLDGLRGAKTSRVEVPASGRGAH